MEWASCVGLGHTIISVSLQFWTHGCDDDVDVQQIFQGNQ